MSVKTGKNISCKVCGKKFYVSGWRLGKATFCSYHCDYKDRKERVCGKGNSFWGKQHTAKTIRKISGKNSPNWRGGITRHPTGYVRILNKKHPRADSKGYVSEHILVMEQHLKRRLKPKEVIHHINKDPSDNSLKNLILFSDNEAHLRFHRIGDFRGTR